VPLPSGRCVYCMISSYCRAKSIRRYVIRAGVVLTNLASKGSVLDRVMTTDPEFDDPSGQSGSYENTPKASRLLLRN